jgi:acyl carrier protein
MTVEAADLMSEVKIFIQDHNDRLSREELETKLTSATDFIGDEYVDSMLFVELIDFIHERFGISVDLDRIDPRAWKSFGAFCAAVAAQK